MLSFYPAHVIYVLSMAHIAQAEWHYSTYAGCILMLHLFSRREPAYVRAPWHAVELQPKYSSTPSCFNQGAGSVVSRIPPDCHVQRSPATARYVALVFVTEAQGSTHLCFVHRSASEHTASEAFPKAYRLCGHGRIAREPRVAAVTWSGRSRTSSK